MEAITRDSIIGDVIKKHPEMFDALANEGIKCAGCGSAEFEPLGMGLAGHGKTEEEIDAVLDRLNSMVVKATKSALDPKTGTLTITSAAATKLKQLLTSKEKNGYGLRISVKIGGCSGKKYEFSYENTKEEHDTVIEKDGAQFYFDEISMEQLDGSQIDYKDDLQDSGFKISNPNAKSTCGCGESFN